MDRVSLLGGRHSICAIREAVRRETDGTPTSFRRLPSGGSDSQKSTACHFRPWNLVTTGGEGPQAGQDRRHLTATDSRSVARHSSTRVTNYRETAFQTVYSIKPSTHGNFGCPKPCRLRLGLVLPDHVPATSKRGCNPANLMFGDIYPEGILDVLRCVHRTYPYKRIFVSEFGFSDA